MTKIEEDSLWYLLGDAPHPIGPVTTHQVKRGLEAARIPATVKVARAGENDWRKIIDVPEFAPCLRPEAAPAPQSQNLAGSGGEWYLLADNNEIRGPLTTAALRTLLETGAVKASHRVSRPGAEAWQTLSEVPELQPRAQHRNLPSLPAIPVDTPNNPNTQILAVDPVSGVEVLGPVESSSLALSYVPSGAGRLGLQPYGVPPQPGAEATAMVLARNGAMGLAKRDSSRAMRYLLVALGGMFALTVATAGLVALGVAGYRTTLPTVRDVLAAGKAEGSQAPDLNREGRFGDMQDHRNITALYPFGGDTPPKAWHYHVTWRNGRVAEYARLNPAGVRTETYAVQYGPGDDRVVRKNTGYGVLEYEDVITTVGQLSRKWRSGVRDFDRCASLQREFGVAGRVTLEKCLDTNGIVVARSDGCFIRKLAYGEHGELTEIACLQDDATPMDDAEGVHRTLIVHDNRGAVEEENYFASNGQRMPRRSDGCARRRFTRDAAGNVVKDTCLDASGVPQRIAGETHASVGITRDENGCWTEKLFFVAEESSPEKMRLVQRTDRFCTPTHAEHRNDAGKLLGMGWDAELTAEGFRAVMRCRTEYGNAQCPNAGYYASGTRGSLVKWEYDDRGRSTHKRCYNADGTPSRCDSSYPHEERYQYNELGRLTTTSWFDDQGEIATWMGIARMEDSYNVLGRLTSDRYFDKDGNRTNDRCGTGGNVFRFDAKQRLVGIDQRDKDGNLKVSHCNVSLNGIRWPGGSARVEVTRTASGSTKNEYYSATGTLLKTIDCSLPNAECFQ